MEGKENATFNGSGPLGPLVLGGGVWGGGRWGVEARRIFIKGPLSFL